MPDFRFPARAQRLILAGYLGVGLVYLAYRLIRLDDIGVTVFFDLREDWLASHDDLLTRGTMAVGATSWVTMALFAWEDATSRIRLPRAILLIIAQGLQDMANGSRGFLIVLPLVYVGGYLLAPSPRGLVRRFFSATRAFGPIAMLGLILFVALAFARTHPMERGNQPDDGPWYQDKEGIMMPLWYASLPLEPIDVMSQHASTHGPTNGQLLFPWFALQAGRLGLIDHVWTQNDALGRELLLAQGDFRGQWQATIIPLLVSDFGPGNVVPSMALLMGACQVGFLAFRGRGVWQHTIAVMLFFAAFWTVYDSYVGIGANVLGLAYAGLLAAVIRHPWLADTVNCGALSGTRVHVLAFTRFYLPGFKGGGPSKAIVNLAERLTSEVEIAVVTGDRDLGEGPYTGIRRHVWTTAGPTQTLYVRGHITEIPRLRRIANTTCVDIVYVNSIFDPVFSWAPAWHALVRREPRPVVIAPRGSFSPAALSIKPRRKRAFLFVARLLLASGRARRLVTWQATSAEEAAWIRRSIGPDCRIVTAPDLPSSKSGLQAEHARKESGSVRLGFVSRIAQMKNLVHALDVLARMEGPISFRIAGPVEDPKHWQECLARIRSLPADIHVEVIGGLPADQVAGFLAGLDLMILPTLGENNGYVIHEALAVGTPVLISDRTPWRGLASLGVGWDLPLDDLERFRAAIASVRAMDEEEHRVMRSRAIAHANAVSDDPAMLAASRSLFLDAASSAAKPTDDV